MQLGPTTARGAMALCALLITLAPRLAGAQGTVQIPLDQYERLAGGAEPDDASGAYAFSQVRVSVAVGEADASATVTVDAVVDVLTDRWTLVPIASAGAAVTSVTDAGQPVGLATRGGALVWPTNAEGRHPLRWVYRVDARRFGDGRVISLALPAATAELTATIPGTDRGVTVVPASAFDATAAGSATRVTATLPATGAAQLAWRDAVGGGFTLSRARYRGRLDGDVVRFEAELTVELDGAARARVPLFPTAVALEEVRVDRGEAAIASEDGAFVVPVAGRGRHRIEAAFVVPVASGDGLPGFDLRITPTPVSRFELDLPGEREVTVTPHAGVRVARRDGRSRAVFHVPMSSAVAVRWAEAVPVEASEVQTRAHANLVHVVRPDDGVLTVQAHASWEITRGAMSRAALDLPDDVQVNAVTSSAGVVSDWRVADEGRGRVISVFLDREVRGALSLAVEYERAWPTGTRTSEPFEVPLLRARDVTRQRGMLALLAARELTLEPREEARVSRVGDNLLPPAIRDAIEGTVAHTWRYLDEPPRVVAVGAVREPEPARFDAQVDTLVSLDDVTTTITSTIEIEVKSGALDALSLRVPEGLELLEVTAPSLRHHALSDDGILRIELTQPMEGRFRVEVVCERITEQEEQLEVPLLGVVAAEVERGRIGVEALAPFGVDARAVERMSPIDPAELPEQLLLRTDNPILHAYRYAQADPAPRFSVGITRHREVQTPHAVIDEATYRTLYTRDGVAVTTARYLVRNRRQQFLRVGLPEGAEVWSARVDRRDETPAIEASSEGDAPTVLLEIVSAADAFEVELVYATPVPSLGAFGRLNSELPRLRVVVTRTTWELFVPSDAHYAEPSTSMTLTARDHGTAAALADEVPDAMALDVPREGVRYVFREMYAGRDGAPASVSLPYVAGWGGPFVHGLSALGALLLCLGLLAFAIVRLGLSVPPALAQRLPVRLATYRALEDAVPPARGARRRLWLGIGATSALGAGLLSGTLGYLSANAWPALTVAALVGLGALGMVARREIDRRRAAPDEEPA